MAGNIKLLGGTGYASVFGYWTQNCLRSIWLSLIESSFWESMNVRQS